MIEFAFMIDRIRVFVKTKNTKRMFRKMKKR